MDKLYNDHKRRRGEPISTGLGLETDWVSFWFHLYNPNHKRARTKHSLWAPLSSQLAAHEQRSNPIPKGPCHYHLAVFAGVNREFLKPERLPFGFPLNQLEEGLPYRKLNRIQFSLEKYIILGNPGYLQNP